MNVTCNKCGKKYVISDEKVAGKTSVKIRCKQCQNLIAVAVTVGANGAGANGQGGYASSPSGAYASTASGTFTSAPSGAFSSSPSGAVSVSAPVPPRQQEWESERHPAPPSEATWHAMIAGKQQGPFDLSTISRKIAGGEVTLRTYLWKPGMGDWKRAADVPDVSPLFAGASAGATATAAVQSPTSSTRTPAVQRDVAVANEVPSPELTRKKSTTVMYGGNEAKAAIAAAQAAAAEADAEEARQKKAAPLNDLFNDINPSSALNAQAGGVDAHAAASGEAPVSDPFAQLAPKEGEAPPPGEATKFFIAKAGVNKRNPPWKIALFVLSGVGVPVLLGWVLTTFHIVNLPTVTTTNEDGQEVQEPFFSTGGISGLKDALTGDAKRKKEEAERLRKQKEAALLAANRPKQPTHAAGTPDKTPVDEPVAPPKPQDPDLVAHYTEGGEVGNTVIKKRKDEPDTKPALDTGAGLSREVANKIIADKMKTFQLCVDTAMHRNPKLAVGKITLKLTVGASGAVKGTGIDPPKWENADWAVCMATAAKRITFPSSDGDTELQAPITVGIAMGP